MIIGFCFPSIKAVLSRVEGFCASLGDAVLAPKLVLLGAVLCVGVGDYVSATATPEDHDSSHLVMWKVFLVD